MRSHELLDPKKARNQNHSLQLQATKLSSVVTDARVKTVDRRALTQEHYQGLRIDNRVYELLCNGDGAGLGNVETVSGPRKFD